MNSSLFLNISNDNQHESVTCKYMTKQLLLNTMRMNTKKILPYVSDSLVLVTQLSSPVFCEKVDKPMSGNVRRCRM